MIFLMQYSHMHSSWAWLIVLVLAVPSPALYLYRATCRTATFACTTATTFVRPACLHTCYLPYCLPSSCLRYTLPSFLPPHCSACHYYIPVFCLAVALLASFATPSSIPSLRERFGFRGV
jgi:hypothetical protein